MGNGHMDPPPPEQGDRHLRKHYLLATSLAGGNNYDEKIVPLQEHYIYQSKRNQFTEKVNTI